MLELRRRVAGVVEAEHDAGPRCAFQRDVGQLRVVRIRDEHRRLRQLARRRAPTLRQELELPVAVELVAEEIPQRERARLHAPRDLGQRRLVDLEQPQLRVPRGDERRGDPGDEVGARPVVREPPRAAQDRRDHGGRGRLAVGRRDQRRPLRQPRREPVDSPRVELPEELAWQRRAAAGSR
jgi:hypothetical protein